MGKRTREEQNHLYDNSERETGMLGSEQFSLNVEKFIAIKLFTEYFRSLSNTLAWGGRSGEIAESLCKYSCMYT